MMGRRILRNWRWGAVGAGVLALFYLVYLIPNERVSAQGVTPPVHNFGVAATVPLPASSCFYVDQFVSGSTFQDAHLCSQYAAAIGAAGLATNNNMTGTNNFNGPVNGINNSQTAAFNIDPTVIPCGATIQYNSASAGNATALSTLQPGCNYAIDAVGAGLLTVVQGAGATLVTACTAARTRASHSVIWVHTEAPGVVNVSGDCP